MATKDPKVITIKMENHLTIIIGFWIVRLDGVLIRTISDDWLKTKLLVDNEKEMIRDAFRNVNIPQAWAMDKKSIAIANRQYLKEKNAKA